MICIMIYSKLRKRYLVPEFLVRAVFAGDTNKWKKVVGGSSERCSDFQPFSKSIFLMETEDCSPPRHLLSQNNNHNDQ